MFGDSAAHQGNVVWFNKAKGYGFIREASGREIFCHFSVVRMEGYKFLQDGQRVEFEIEQGQSSREQAANVRVVSGLSQDN